VNDNPQGGEGGLESGMVHGGKEPLEVYFASWKSPNQSKEAKGEPIGYFYFLDGGFRWDSLISFPKSKSVMQKSFPAKLIKKVEPVYPADAAAQHIFGTVRVYYVIGGDGAVYNAHALSGEGLSEDPPFEKLQRMRSFNGDINQRQWTASQFKQMPSRLTLRSLRRAEGRIANRLNSAALNGVFVCQSLPAPSCVLIFAG